MRRHLRAATLVVGLGTAAALLTACGSDTSSDSSDTITIATTPLGDDPTKANPIEALADLLGSRTGRPVEIRDVPDYLSVVEAVRSDHVDFGIMSGFPSALAVNTGEVDPLLAWKGDDEPVSTCVVLEDSPVHELGDLRGRTVAFADQASSSGYFMPVYMLHDAGLTQGTDYKSVFAGGHEGSFAALAQGQVDAACTANMLTRLGPPMFPFAEGEWRGVGQSPSMPIMGAVLARPSLDEDTRTTLQEAIPAVFSEENADALGALGSGFIGRETVLDPDPAEFRPFIDIAAVAGVDLSDLSGS